MTVLQPQPQPQILNPEVGTATAAQSNSHPQPQSRNVVVADTLTTPLAQPTDEIDCDARFAAQQEEQLGRYRH